MKSMKLKFPYRIVINTTDVANITGQTQRSARRLLRKIRMALNKNDDDFVTVAEFCSYCGINEEEVREFFA
jgi:hypothetical protein